ncbi:MAG: type II toxin-antitoxin system VapC family toxin, partial [Burkholderiaceae bacterium]
MSYLLDTNVISELRRRQPIPGVMAWAGEVSPSDLYLSVLSFGEIRKGLEQLSDVAKRRSIAEWLESDLPRYFQGRVLPIDLEVSQVWGRLLASARRPVAEVDSLIAATAQ